MPYGQSALFRHLTAESSSPSTAPTSASAPSANSTAKTSGVSVLSGSAAANTIAEMHKANSLSVGSYPGRIGNGLATRRPMQILPVNRRQLFTGFHEDDALVLAQSPIPGDRKNCTTNDSTSRFSAGPENRFFVRREAWKHLNIPRCVRTSIIERSSMVASNLERQVDENEESVSRGECPQKPLRLSTGAGDATPGPTSATKVQFVDSTSSTPFPPRKPTINEKQETESKQISPIPTLNPKSTSSNNTCEQSDAGNWTLPPDVTLNQTTLAEPNADDGDSSPVCTVNKAGICLSKPGYYIFPTLDELDDLVDEDGRCVVQDFVIGRQSYGHILFPGLTDITGINFDEVVHIRRREVVVYPDDTTKPPQGYGLNRKAEITLDGVWPTDKSTLEFIKSPQRLASIRFDERLEKATQKLDASFIEYRPETGSWVFEVKHFSKYRLEDSDEEVDHVRSPLNAPDKSRSVHQKDRQLSTTVVGDAVDSQGAITSEKEQQPRYFSSGQDFLWQAQTVSPQLLQPTQAFRGVRDSLFDAGSRFREENEDGVDEEESDFRRHIQFEMIDKSPPLVEFEDTTKRLPEVDEAQAYAEFETLQSVHNPFPSTGPAKISPLDKGLVCTLPYDRIGELINCTPKSSIGLHRYYFDSGLSKGDVARLSWSFLRLSGQPPQLTFLTANPNMDPPVTVVANSIPSISDEDEEVLLNSALLTSTHTTADTDSSACPMFSPDIGPHVLNSYLSCTDQWDHNAQPRKVAFRRALLVCQALWADPHCCTSVIEDTYHEALGLHKYFVERRQNDYKGEPMQTDCEESDVKRNPHHYTVSGMKSLVRRQSVAEWIRVELRPYLESRLKSLGLAHLFKAKASPHSLWSLGDKVPKSSVFAGIFACLCCGEPAIACRLALTCRMSHLASCLSMAALCDPLCKQSLKKQLQIWNELKVLPFMPQDILRTYALLAGEIKVSITGADAKTVLNVLAGVPYLQALGIHLWYLVDHSSDLAAALKLFSRNWHAHSTFEVAPPRPLEDDELVMCQEETAPKGSLSHGALSRSSPRDVCYHLLRLASRPWHSLERTLDPGSIRQRCGDLLAGTDWPSAWHLWRVLVSLGLSSLNPIATSRLHVEFASHLEACGLWEWAVFVLMHEAEPRVRAASVKQLLARHVTLQRPLRSPHGDWRLDQESVGRYSRAELFIMQKFGVSVKWFHEAKACLARSLNAAQLSSSNPDNYKLLSILEASHWLASGHVESAHGVYMRHILPNMLLRYNTDAVSSILAGTRCKSGRSASLATKLLTILQLFADISREHLPVSFDLGAGIYLMYGRILHLAHRLNLCKNGGIGAADEDCREDTKTEASPSTVSEILADLQASAQHMVDLLQSMPTHSIQERIVKSEMAMTVFRLISSSLHPQTTNEIGEQAAEESLTVDDSDMSLLLCQRLNLVASIGLPVEMKLAELETLSAESLASGIF
uniref:Nuclear pore complex protein Nup98-Nup96 n=2 Tax=Mesocestoides corti TaxID=53468 RepID=A0A5K3FMZ1_MESCO